jgi:two-component system response regulator
MATKFLKRIKNDPRTSRIPVIVPTASGEEKDLMKSYLVGADRYIIKPVDFEKFTESVSDTGKYRLVIDRSLPA